MKQYELEILLVEDNQNDAEMTLHVLNKNKLANKVHWVEDGEQALEFLFATGEYADRNIKDRPKLILLDLKLPKVGGMEVLQKLKSDSQMKTIPVVILTSSQEETDIIKGYELGVNSYIVKPVDFQQFSKSIGDLGLYWMLLNKLPT